MYNVQIVAMRAGTGRLSTAVSKAMELAKEGRKVLFISDEVSSETVVRESLRLGYTQDELIGVHYKFCDSSAKMGTAVISSKDRGYDALVLHTTSIKHGTVLYQDLLPEGVDLCIYTQANNRG